MKIINFSSAIQFEEEARILWNSLLNAREDHPELSWRLSRLMDLAWSRYSRRVEIRKHWFDIEQGTCTCFSCTFLSDTEQTNSGDSARLPVGASVEADTVNPSQVGTCETVEAGQGGNHSHIIEDITIYPVSHYVECQKDDPFVNDFCNCDSCSIRHDDLAGIHFARAWCSHV